MVIYIVFLFLRLGIVLIGFEFLNGWGFGRHAIKRYVGVADLGLGKRGLA